jgi:hypothetical protein
VDRASAWLTAKTFVSPMRYATFNGAQPDTTDESLRSAKKDDVWTQFYPLLDK